MVQKTGFTEMSYLNISIEADLREARLLASVVESSRPAETITLR